MTRIALTVVLLTAATWVELSIQTGATWTAK